MLLINEISVTVLGRCWQCAGHLDCADVPWLECEACGMAWLVGEAIVERIDIPEAIKGHGVVCCGSEAGWHSDMTIVMWDGTHTFITEDDPIPLDARSLEIMYERRRPADFLIGADA